MSSMQAAVDFDCCPLVVAHGKVYDFQSEAPSAVERTAGARSGIISIYAIRIRALGVGTEVILVPLPRAGS